MDGKKRAIGKALAKEMKTRRSFLWPYCYIIYAKGHIYIRPDPLTLAYHSYILGLVTNCWLSWCFRDQCLPTGRTKHWPITFARVYKVTLSSINRSTCEFRDIGVHRSTYRSPRATYESQLFGPRNPVTKETDTEHMEQSQTRRVACAIRSAVSYYIMRQ